MEEIDTRALVRKFLELPFLHQLRVMQAIGSKHPGLIPTIEDFMREEERSLLRFFKLVKDTDLLEELSRETEKRHAEYKTT